MVTDYGKNLCNISARCNGQWLLEMSRITSSVLLFLMKKSGKLRLSKSCLKWMECWRNWKLESKQMKLMKCWRLFSLPDLGIGISFLKFLAKIPPSQPCHTFIIQTSQYYKFVLNKSKNKLNNSVDCQKQSTICLKKIWICFYVFSLLLYA